MNYQDFIEDIKKFAHHELGYSYEHIRFYPKGFTSEDAAELKWIRKCNLNNLGKDGNTLLSDFIVIKKKVTNEITVAQNIAVELLFHEAEENGIGHVYNKLKQADSKFPNTQTLTNSIKERINNSYEDIKKQLIVRPLNFNRHEKELQDCVYEKHGDIALVLYQLIGEEHSMLTSCKIHKADILHWDISGHEEDILDEALQNTAKRFPAHILNAKKNCSSDLMKGDFKKEDVMFMGVHGLLSTNRTTNGAAAIFYPGVISKLMEIMGGAFLAVFMNINDVMFFDMESPMAREFAKTANESSIMGEMLSDKVYICNENGIREFMG